MSAKKNGKKKRRDKTPARPLYTLHIVSDATGNLASHMISAILTQFPELRFKEVYHIFKNKKKDVEETIQSFRRKHHIVLYALIDPESKKTLHEACARLQIPSYDLTGSLVQFIADHTGCPPVNELARLHETHAGYFQRIDAMEFTAQHDDGRRLDTINEADVIVVGLSRVSKSPTSTYLGSLGYKVANVSIAPETGFPEQLRGLKKKIVAFTLQPKALAEIRTKRFEQFDQTLKAKRIDGLPYYDLRSIIDEVVYAEKEYRKRGYPVIDITGLTVEEIAATTLDRLGIKRKSMAYT